MSPENKHSKLTIYFPTGDEGRQKVQRIKDTAARLDMTASAFVRSATDALLGEGRFSKDGIEKALALSLMLGPERVMPIFKHLSNDEIDILSSHIVRMQHVTVGKRDSILQEAHREAVTSGFIQDNEVESVPKPAVQPRIVELEEQLLEMQKRRSELEGQVLNIAEDNPEVVATLIREWMDKDYMVKSSPC